MKSKTLNVYMGYDSRETEPYAVARHSILSRTKEPLKIIPVKLGHMDFFTRPIERRNGQLWCPISDAPMSTEFAISRFAVPFIQQTGWCAFVDCDIICWSDIAELFALTDDKYAVMVVKHHHAPQNWSATIYQDRLVHTSCPKPVLTKMDGQQQTYYNRKNWSSVVLWNCDHEANQRFHVEHLNSWPGRDLHAFKWLEDSEIGSLPQHWNWLVNVTPGEPEKKGIWHYTLGGAWFENWTETKYDRYWIAESFRMNQKVA